MTADSARHTGAHGPALLDRVRGCAVGAAVGDALGMPLEFHPPRPASDLVRELLPGRLPPGSFTDDTEMALALAESLLHQRPLDLDDLAQRFAAWASSNPPDIGIQTRQVLGRVAAGEPWEAVIEDEQRRRPDAAGNGSLMRCWPVALAYWDEPGGLLHDSQRQSRVTHPHPDCLAACALVNITIAHLLRGIPPDQALDNAIEVADLAEPFKLTVRAARIRDRGELANSGWVRHTVESAVWALLTTNSFEDAVVSAVNLGHDADTSGAVTGALAGAAYGCAAIPDRWIAALRGEWPNASGQVWTAGRLIELADQLLMPGGEGL